MTIEIVKEIVSDVLGINADMVTPDADFEKDLGANSLDRVEIIMNLEDRLNISIPDEALENIVTVKDAVSKIEELI